MNRFRVLFLFLSLSLFSGCALAGMVMSIWSDIGATEGDRAALMDKALKEYGQALYWRDLHKALAFATDDFREELKEELLDRKRNEQVVETKVDFVDFLDGAHTAEVDFVTKYYRVPYYVVKERHERQLWTFSLSDRWELNSMEEQKD